MTTRAAKRKAARPVRVVKDPGPMRGMRGSKAEGMTNRECLAGIQEALGGPPERGKLYRVSFGQGVEGRTVSMIAEYAGLVMEHWSNGALEPALSLIIRNPVFPEPIADGAEARPRTPEEAMQHRGTQADPFLLWPLDVHHISPAEPGDLDRPMHYRVEGEPEARAIPGTPVQ